MISIIIQRLLLPREVANVRTSLNHCLIDGLPEYKYSFFLRYRFVRIQFNF